MEEQKTNQSGYGQQEGYSGYGYEGNPFEQMDQDLCKRCHRRKIDRSENPESVLCKDCREELIKLKVPPVMTGVSILVALLVLACITVFALDFIKLRTGRDPFTGSPAFVSEGTDKEAEKDNEDKENIAVGEEESEEDDENRHRRLDNWVTEETDPVSQAYADMADTGMVVTALDSMVDALEEDPDNVSMAIALTDVAMKYSYPDYAAYAIDSYLAGKNVSDEVYDRISGYIDKLDIYYNTYDVVDEVWNVFGDEVEALGNDATEDDYAELLQTCHDEIELYLGMEEFDQAFLYYDLAYVCQDTEERIQHLKDCIAIDPYYFDANAQLGTYYRRQGDLEEARKILENSYAVNREVYSVLRSLATLELVEGNLELGLEYAKNAYDIYSEGEYVVDTYLVALMANGQMEEAETLIRQYEDEGYLFDDDFYAFQMGDMTLEEYYIGD